MDLRYLTKKERRILLENVFPLPTDRLQVCQALRRLKLRRIQTPPGKEIWVFFWNQISKRGCCGYCIIWSPLRRHS